MPADSIDLSAIILTYNTRDLTRACVRSALGDSTAYTIEIIVVDNASTDDTAAILQKEFPAIRLIISPDNVGFARGNNLGLATARGKYLLLLNSDTEIQNGALNVLIDFMNSHIEAGACGPLLLNEDGSLQPSGRSLPSLFSVFVGMTHMYRLWKRDFYTERGRDYNAIKRVGEVSGAALLVRRDIYEKCGGLDPNLFAYYEDIDWCKRVGAAGYAIYYVPQAKVIHHWHATSRAVSELSYRAGQDSLRYYFKKHHGSIVHGSIQLLLASKEIALITASLLRRDQSSRRFHQAMLKNVFEHLNQIGSDNNSEIAARSLSE